MTDPPAPFSPPWLSKVEHLAQSGDPFFLGAQWAIDQLEASANGGGFSHSKETP